MSLNSRLLSQLTLSSQVLPRSCFSRQRVCIPRKHLSVRAIAAPTTATPSSWSSISVEAGKDLLAGYTLMPENKPSSAPTNTLPTEASSSTDKPVLLYRDTNAWCPYCERVWFALEEKQIPYDVVLIDLANKPDWYIDVVPTKLVPAIRINDEVVYESYDILMKLEEAFPEPPLLPRDEGAKAEAQQLMDKCEAFARAGYAAISGRTFGPNGGTITGDALTAARDQFMESLRELDSALAKHGGPFFMGSAVSMVDIMYMPSLERFKAMYTAASLAHHPQLPNLARWYAALDKKPAYQKVKSDEYTLQLLFKRRFSAQPAAPDVDEATQNARREVAAKIAANRQVITKDILKNSGLAGTTPTAEHTENGSSGAVQVDVEEGIDFTLRRLCDYLLTGMVGSGHPQKAMGVVSAATLAFFHNRASSPRDLSAAAASQLRAACLELLKETY